MVECGNALLKNGYKLKILNTINFKKSMHYNPFAYVHSEKDILKLVTTLMTNTKGEGSGGDPFWEKSERLLLTALIAYLHYEAPVEEQNFATLLEMLNTMQVLEDDEEYQNPVDLLFEELAKKKPNSFAVRQYKLYKLAAGMAGSQRLFHHRQYLRPPRLRFQALVCTGDAGGAGLWQCVSMMPYAPKTGWTGDVPAKKNGQTNKIHLSIRFGGASGSRTLAPVSRPIAFRVRPLTTT